MKYKNKCTRCGMCCLNETCPIGKSFYGIRRADKCSGLDFDKDIATCELVGKFPDTIMGIGAGCCIKARAIKDGVEFDFADFKPDCKKAMVALVRKGKIPLFSQHK